MTFGCWQNIPGATIVTEVQKATGAWVNVSADVLPKYTDLQVQMAGRQTELDRSEPGALRLALNDSAGTYTPGLASAPVMLTQGMPIRVRETIGRCTNMLFTGEIQQAEFVCDVPGHDRVVVMAVDWLGGQNDGGRTFTSTLAEWIRYHGGSALQAYWPLLDTTLPAIEVASSGPSLAASSHAVFTSFPVDDSSGLVSPGGGERVTPGDDAAGFAFTPFIDAASTKTLVNSRLETSSLAVTLGANQLLSVCAWFNPTAGDQVLNKFPVYLSGADINNEYVYVALNPTTLKWELWVGFSGYIATVVGPVVRFGEWAFVTAQVQLSGTTQRLWINNMAYTATATGAPPPATQSFTRLWVGQNFNGTASHVQIYLGGSTSYLQNDHSAQLAAGTDDFSAGLAWQRTDERISTLAQYAGLSTAQLALDVGSSWMPAASLAGRTFSQASTDAVDTEQGRQFVSGDGHLTFHNRARTVYNH